MIEIPETRDLFRSHEHVRVESGWSVGSDLGAEIVVADDGRVVAVSELGEALVNSSLDQYILSLTTVGTLRDLPVNELSDSAVIDCETALREIDQFGYDVGQYWALIVEQIMNEQF